MYSSIKTSKPEPTNFKFTALHYTYYNGDSYLISRGRQQCGRKQSQPFKVSHKEMIIKTIQCHRKRRIDLNTRLMQLQGSHITLLTMWHMHRYVPFINGMNRIIRHGTQYQQYQQYIKYQQSVFPLGRYIQREEFSLVFLLIYQPIYHT